MIFGASGALVARETPVSPRKLRSAAQEGKAPADWRRISPAKAAVVVSSCLGYCLMAAHQRISLHRGCEEVPRHGR
jgi:hypothetical protein